MQAIAAALTLVALLLAGLPGARAQTTKSARMGVLLYSSPSTDANVPVLREALRGLGWVEGRNLTIEYRFAEGKFERLPDLAEELVRLRPDLIYAAGGDVAPYAKKATATIPIVATVSNDPVESGLVASLRRPGGNVTGVTFLLSDLAGKRLEMLHEIAPGLSRVAVLWNPDHADSDFRETQALASRLGMRVVALEARRPGDIDAALQTAVRERAEALIVVSSRLMSLQRQRILDFAAHQRLLLATGWGAWTDDGALFTYGPNIDEMVRRAATHVDKILRGAKPGDLPMEQPTTFELVINLKTARALGLTVPPSLLVRADRVLE
jgi:putative ABC transport system substrate-binding protein